MRTASPELTTAVWWKPSYSDATGGDCLEVGDSGELDLLPVRDGRNPDAAVPLFKPAAWGAFLAHVR